MNILELVRGCRSVRRFDESRAVTLEQLRYMVEVARLTASTRNRQPLKYITVTNPELCEKLLDATGWASSLVDGKPTMGERPTAYIVIYNDTAIAPNSLWDQGIVSYAMMMAAAEMGIGGTILATIFRDKLPDLGATEALEPALILGLGYPNENIAIVDVVDDETKYYRDENRNHFVPKRIMSEILIKEIE